MTASPRHRLSHRLMWAVGVVLVSVTLNVSAISSAVSRPGHARAAKVEAAASLSEPASGVAPGVTLGSIRIPRSADLLAVTAPGPNDVWAVGDHHRAGTLRSHSLVEHWNGSNWAIVQTPDIGRLNAVDASGPNDVWAISGGPDALHWDGVSWHHEQIPGPPSAYLSSISVRRPNDIWVAGDRSGPHIHKHFRATASLTEHWNGHSWTIVPTPNPGKRDTDLDGIVALSANDVWASGGMAPNGRLDFALTMHWNGKRWKTVDVPEPSSRLDVLWGIGADGGGGVWAVGHHYADPSHHLAGMILHWSRSRWRLTRFPKGPQWSPTLVSGTSSHDVWAVGSEPTSTFAIAHWDGSRWKLVVAPSSYNRVANGLAVVSPTEAWVVGESERASGEPFVKRWNGTKWRLTPVPLP